MKNTINKLINEYRELFDKEVPVSILLHNDETIIYLLEKEIQSKKDVKNEYGKKYNDLQFLAYLIDLSFDNVLKEYLSDLYNKLFDELNNRYGGVIEYDDYI